jgi:RNA 2',3'-cyclic 3'-phosphodiesterase
MSSKDRDTGKSEISRVFFALWPTEAARRGLVDVQQQLQPRFKGKIMRAPNLHMTLAFLGNIPAERVDEAKAVADDLQCTSFAMLVDQLGLWKRSQVLWAAPSQPPDALMALATDLQDALRSCGFRLEARAFRPHVTLLRKAYGEISESLLSPVDWAAHEFVLARTPLEQPGGNYDLIGRWPLILPGDKVLPESGAPVP